MNYLKQSQPFESEVGLEAGADLKPRPSHTLAMEKRNDICNTAIWVRNCLFSLHLSFRFVSNGEDYRQDYS